MDRPHHPFGNRSTPHPTQMRPAGMMRPASTYRGLALPRSSSMLGGSGACSAVEHRYGAPVGLDEVHLCAMLAQRVGQPVAAALAAHDQRHTARPAHTVVHHTPQRLGVEALAVVGRCRVTHRVFWFLTFGCFL